MAKTTDKVNWRVKGEYFETCSCDFLCPCPTTNLSARPTKGSCTFAFVHRIDDGRYGDVNLHGLHFAVLGRTPEASRDRKRSGRRPDVGSCAAHR